MRTLGQLVQPVPMSQDTIPSDTQGRRWFFTLYDEDDLRIMRNEPHIACVAAWEEGEKNGKQHLQTYIKFSSNKRFSWFKKRLSDSAHIELAKGPEWKCRRYIADVEAYLRDEPNAHPKKQGDIVHDYGCDIEIPEGASTVVKCVKAIAQGCKLVQIWKQHPIYFFHNYRKLKDLHEFLQHERDQGEDVLPTNYDEEPKYKKARLSKPDES